MDSLKCHYPPKTSMSASFAAHAGCFISAPSIKRSSEELWHYTIFPTNFKPKKGSRKKFPPRNICHSRHTPAIPAKAAIHALATAPDLRLDGRNNKYTSTMAASLGQRNQLWPYKL